jgi:hypothetical protein
VLIDLTRHHYGPVVDPIRSLFVSGTGQDVHSVWVEGRRAVEGGRVLRADEAALRRAAEGVFRSTMRAARERDPVGASLREILGLDYEPPVLRGS